MRNIISILLFTVLLSCGPNDRQESGISSYLWTILFLLLLTGLITAILSLINKNRKTNDEIKRLDRKISHLSPANSNHQSTIELKKLEEKINKLGEKIDRLESKYIGKSDVVTVEQPVEVEWQVTRKEMIEPLTFFMATPDKEGFFNTSSHHTSFRQGATYYKFYPSQKNENLANFEFFSDEYGIKAAANYPQTYIEPVCEPQNAQNPNAKKIITIANEKGKAEKRGDKWIVTQKAKIRYE